MKNCAITVEGRLAVSGGMQGFNHAPSTVVLSAL